MLHPIRDPRYPPCNIDNMNIFGPYPDDQDEQCRSFRTTSIMSLFYEKVSPPIVNLESISLRLSNGAGYDGR